MQRGLLRYAVAVDQRLIAGYGLHLFLSDTQPDAAAFAEDFVYDAFVDEMPEADCAFRLASATQANKHKNYLIANRGDSQ